MVQPVIPREQLMGQQDSEERNPSVLPRTFFEPDPARAAVRRAVEGSGPNIDVDYTSPGVNPFRRGMAELMADTPEELQLWAQNTYGEDATILPGSALGFERGTPEASSMFLSRGYDQPFEVFDPSQGLAAVRARGAGSGVGGGLAGLGGRLGEIGAETIETGVAFAPELAAEAGLLALSRGGSAGGLLGRISQMGGWRMRGAARAGYMGGVSAAATGGGSSIQQIIQEQAGTQAQTREEQIAQSRNEAALAGAFSLMGSAAKMGGYLGIDAILGRTSEEGERLLSAAREFNLRAQRGENVEPLADPLIAYTSNNPVTQATFNFLSRMSPEIAEYQRNFRASLLRTAERQGEAGTQGEFPIRPDDEVREALNDQYQLLRERILRPAAAADSADAGREAVAYLGAFADESYRAAADAYENAFARMAAETGDSFDINYNLDPLREAIREGRSRRVVPADIRGEGGEFSRGTINIQPGEAASWRVFSEIASTADAMTRGDVRVPPIAIVRMIQDINDQLVSLGPDATDAGTTALRRLKRGLNAALDSLPEENAGRYSQETLDTLRSANTLFRERAQILDSAGVITVMRHGQQQNYSQAAAALYDGGLSSIRNVRDAVRQIEGGEQKWNTLRNNWLAYALNVGDESSPFRRWQSLPNEVKRELFSEAERADIAQNLRALDGLVNSTGFRSVIDAADDTGTFLDNVILQTTAGRGKPYALQQVEAAIRNAALNGNTAPRRAYTAGLWDHILRQSGVIAERNGETSINSRAFGRVVRRLDEVGALDILDADDRQFLDTFGDLIRSSDTEIGSAGSSIAVAGMISEIAGGQNLASNFGRVLSAKLASNALILGNRQLRGLEGAIAGRGPVNLPTSMARTAYHYAADENDVSSREWEEYVRSLRGARPETIMNPAQR